MKELILSTLKSIREYESDPDVSRALPCGSFYLEDSRVVSVPRAYGESRFPYDRDGLVLWAHSDGYIDCCESLFNVFRNAMYNEDTPVCFWGGLQTDRFYPVSITGAARQGGEPESIRRYTVFDLRSALYIAETPDVVFAVRVHLSKDKHMHFRTCAVNISDKEQNVYLCSYYEAMLRYIAAEDFFMRMTKYAEHLDCGSYILKSRNAGFDCLTVNPYVSGNVTKRCFTTSKATLLGMKGGNLTNANALFSGKFDSEVRRVNTTDTPVACDMVHYALASGDVAELCHELIITHSEEDAMAAVGTPVPAEIDRALAEYQAGEQAELDGLKIEFTSTDGEKPNAPVFNRFIGSVKKQVEFCAFGKNYAGPHLGIRDVYQQLESALIWNPGTAREKIVSTLDFILSDGRPPRQVSFPPDDKTLPDLDLRPYIDQGLWIISTIHTYLSYTDDLSILDEECSYYNCEATYGPLSFCDTKDTVLDHLVRITDYLLSKIDETTGCLRALYGDWNDALDGLGRTKRDGVEFGTGVTVMATLQFYRNLREMSEIVTAAGKHTDKLGEYARVREGIRDGLAKYAIDVNDAGEKRIIHGWGDLMSYKVGSFNDYDGVARRSLVANSFWSICGMLRELPETKGAIIKAFNELDSKYGMKTFDRHFKMYSPEVGRISTITPGTYENSCVYVHASTFAVMALFEAGESAKAWEQLEKLAVITHDNATMSTFVMPNSYCEAPEYEIDGDSMGDWYTGSGTVFIKAIVRHGFGIQPDLGGVKIASPAVMPTNKASVTLTVKGKKLTLEYLNKGNGERTYAVNGVKRESETDDISGLRSIYIPTAELTDGCVITVED